MRNELIALGEDRLRNVLVIDKGVNASLNSVIKSDILYILKNYMEITAENLNIEIAADGQGSYDVYINAKVRRLISFQSLKDND